MQFDQICEFLLEQQKIINIFILEDLEMRVTLMRSFCAQVIPNHNILTAEDTQTAVSILKDNYHEIDFFTLDYNLKNGETSVAVAHLIKRHFGNNGENVWIHSDDVDGIEEIKKILPLAHVAQAPQNIIEISKAI